MVKRFIQFLLILIVVLAGFKYLKDDSNRPYESSFLYKLTSDEKDKLRTGDIILRRGYGLISTMILRMMNEFYDVTHIGIVVKQDESLEVAHTLSSNVSNQDGLRLQGIDSFVHNSHFNTVLVTRLKDIDSIQQERISKQIDFYKDKDLPFDHRFNYRDSTAHYCSELIWRIYEQNLKILSVSDTVTFEQKYNRLKIFYDPIYFDIVLNHQDQ